MSSVGMGNNSVHVSTGAWNKIFKIKNKGRFIIKKYVWEKAQCIKLSKKNFNKAI